MIPISLTIEGFYSYRTPQTILFDELTSNQLFGIFGPVGSGKSAILEAITFVIFNSSERLNTRDNRLYNMMNLKSDRTFIDFTCWAGEDMKHKYRFIHEATRRKKSDDVVLKDRRILQEIEGEWIPLEKASPEKIVGMEYAHFCQTTIIPQGKFREFIELKPAQRASMLQELFHLNQFDLADKNRRLLGEANSENNRLSGVLEQLETYSQEQTLQLQEALQNAQTALEETKKNLTSQEKQLTAGKELMALQEQYNVQKQKQSVLASKEPQFQLRTETLERYQQAYMHFYERLQQAEQLQKQLTLQQEKHSQLQKSIVQITQQVNDATAYYKKAYEAYQERENIQKKVADLGLIIQIKEIKNTLVTQEKAMQSAQIQLTAIEEKHGNLEQQVQNQELQLEKLKKDSLDLSMLYQLVAWFNQQKQLKEQVAKSTDKLNAGKESLSKLAEQSNTLAQQLPELPQEKGLLEAIKESLGLKQELLAQGEKRLIALKAQEELHRFADQLATGEPCPLCGSLEHPSPAGDFDRANIEAEEKSRKALLQSIGLLEKVMKQQEGIETKQELLATQQEALQTQFETVQQAYKEHQASFPKGTYTVTQAEEVTAALATQERQQKEIAALEQQLKTTKQALLGLQQEKEKQAEAARKYEQAVLLGNNQLQILRQQIKVLEVPQVEKFLGYPLSKLEESLAKGQGQLATVETNFKEAEQALQAKKQQQAQLTGSFEASKEHLEGLSNSLQAHEIQTEEKIATQGFASLQEVQNLLSKQVDIASEKASIEAFERQKQEVSQEVTRLKTALEGRHITPEGLAQLIEAYEQGTARASAQQQAIGQLSRDIAVNEEKLAEKKGYEKQMKILQARLEGLKTLDTMFRGKKFVQFVASIYLKNLVSAANERFFRLTRQQLSLELNEEQAFIVRDYLNGGKVRLLKTLSGGQMFQASLCLALSLAENIQNINRAEKSFFFLDEGFGTLDRESLRVVFDTLKSLKQEHRIVGVISHVEDLKQEIEVAITIENHEDTGSIIHKSWS